MKKSLAIMDYGVGGLNLYSKIKEINPSIGINYFSDAGEIPYGKLDRKKLTKRVEKVIAYLQEQGSEQIVVACHSASSVAHKFDNKNIINLISYTQNCSQKFSNHAQIGIIGGGRTIRSQIYGNCFRKQGYEIVQRIAQPLSILIEKGDVNSAIMKKTLDHILKPMANVDHLILACTHYSVLANHMKKYLKANCSIIDPVDNLILHIKDNLTNYTEGKDSFYTTGGKQNMINVANKVYNLDIEPLLNKITIS